MRTARARILLILGLIVFSSAIATPVSALSKADLFNMEIPMYLPGDDCGTDAGVGGDVAVISTSDNAQAIFTFLISNNFARNNNQPMTAVQAAGVMANIQMESGMNPSLVEKGGTGHGIVQWSFGRWNGGGTNSLQGFAASKNTPWTDLGTQLAFLKQELDTTQWGIDVFQTPEGTHSGHFWPAFTGATDPTVASEAWTRRFERPNETAYQNRKANQFAAAQQFYNQFSSQAPSAPVSTTTGAICASNVANTAIASGSIANVAQVMAGWGGTYRWGGGHDQSGKPTLATVIQQRFQGGTIKDCHEGICPPVPNENGVDCSGFVRAVIYQSTGTDIYAGSTKTPKGFTADTDSADHNGYLIKVPNVSDAQPGDIFIHADVHTGIILTNTGAGFTTAESIQTNKGMGILTHDYNYVSAVYRFVGGAI